MLRIFLMLQMTRTTAIATTSATPVAASVVIHRRVGDSLILLLHRGIA